MNFQKLGVSEPPSALVRTLHCIMISCVIGFAVPGYAASPNIHEAENWQHLFNGKNLDDWAIKVTGYPLNHNYANTFQVRNNKLVVDYSEYTSFENQFGHIFYKHPFSHYALNISYRFVGDQAINGPEWAYKNSGVMLHAQSPDSLTLKQPFPISIEAQFLGGRDNNTSRPTANVCTPGTHIRYQEKLFTTHCLSSQSETFVDGWVDVVIVVLGGGSITHYVNGQEVLKYAQPILDDEAQKVLDKPTTLNSGYIALQAESHPIEFRTVRILNLAGCTDQAANNFQPYFVKSDPGQCEYD